MRSRIVDLTRIIVLFALKLAYYIISRVLKLRVSFIISFFITKFIITTFSFIDYT